MRLRDSWEVTFREKANGLKVMEASTKFASSTQRLDLLNLKYCSTQTQLLNIHARFLMTYRYHHPPKKAEVTAK